MKCTAAFFFLIIFLSCKERVKPVNVPSTQVDKQSGSRGFNRDSSIAAFLAQVYEPDISKSKRRAFRIQWVSPFSFKPTFLFRLEEVGKDKFTLTTKAVAFNDSTDEVFYKGKTIKFAKSIVLDSTCQNTTLSDWNEFNNIIEQTYYWAFENPCPKGDGYVDGMTLMMESMSACCNGQALKYHFNWVHVPRGKFVDAVDFVWRHSDLTKNTRR